MPLRRFALRSAAYGWAAPNTLMGLIVAGAMVAAGGRAHLVAGVVEVHGGRLVGLLGAIAPWCRFDALTLGHVVLGRNEAVLTALRRHEHAHVRQYERWGPLFLPAYAASSGWHWLRGGHAHADNHFERRARAAEQ